MNFKILLQLEEEKVAKDKLNEQLKTSNGEYDQLKTQLQVWQAFFSPCLSLLEVSLSQICYLKNNNIVCLWMTEICNIFDSSLNRRFDMT